MPLRSHLRLRPVRPVILSILTIALLLTLNFQAIAQSPLEELRGVWLTNIDSEVLFSRRELTSALDRLQRLHFNTIYPTVWNWGYTLFPSNTAEKVIGQRVDPHPGFRDRDMLREVIREGHQRGLAIVPWFEFGLMAPADSRLAQRHPDWLTQRRDGTRIWMQGKYPRVWLNPFHPEVQQFILGLIDEIADTYDLDGLQLDDHFGLPVELGYDPYTVNLYQQNHGGQSPPANPNDPEWMRWRANQITQLMQRVFQTVKARKPRAIVALSPNTQEFAYTRFLQDWGTWERTGYVEEILLQVYRSNSASFQQELDRPEIQQARNHIPVGVGILTGLMEFPPVDDALIQQQVQAVRDRQFAGVSFFFYETIKHRENALRSMFPHPMNRPRV